MPTIPLPENSTLDDLRGQAQLVADLIRSGDAGALAMVDEYHPRLNAADLDDEAIAGFDAADAELIVAHLYRFTSWDKLEAHLRIVDEYSHTPRSEQSDYVEADEPFESLACLAYSQRGPDPFRRVERAQRMLADNPALASGSIEALATVGDHAALAAALDDRPDALDAPCGPNGWPLLLYTTYSRVHTDRPEWSKLATTAMLLDRGADSNAGFLWRGLVPPFTALTGALGNPGQPANPHRLEMARLLLEAGADPNDAQALYNNGLGGSDHDDPRHLALLVEFGLGANDDGPWAVRLGEHAPASQRLLNDELEAAAVRDRPRCMAFLVGLGLDLTQPVGRSGRPPVRLAAEQCHHDVLTVLAEAGLDVTLEPLEQFLVMVRSGTSDQIIQLLAGQPGLAERLLIEQPGVIKLVGSAQRAEVIKTLIGLGFDVNARTGGSGATALHQAASSDDVDLARVLVEFGADPGIADTYFEATALGWANHFGSAAVVRYLEPLVAPEA